jgi:hypothetical protein
MVSMSLVYERKAYAKMISVKKGEGGCEWNGVDGFDEGLFKECFKNVVCKGRRREKEEEDKVVMRMGDNIERFVGEVIKERDELSGKVVIESRKVVPLIEEKKKCKIGSESKVKQVKINKRRKRRNVNIKNTNYTNNNKVNNGVITTQIYNDNDEQVQMKAHTNNINNINTDNTSFTIINNSNNNSQQKVRYYKHTRPLYVQALFDKYTFPSLSFPHPHPTTPPPIINPTQNTITHFTAITPTTSLSFYHTSILQTLYSFLFPFHPRPSPK